MQHKRSCRPQNNYYTHANNTNHLNHGRSGELNLPILTANQSMVLHHMLQLWCNYGAHFVDLLVVSKHHV